MKNLESQMFPERALNTGPSFLFFPFGGGAQLLYEVL